MRKYGYSVRKSQSVVGCHGENVLIMMNWGGICYAGKIRLEWDVVWVEIVDMTSVRVQELLRDVSALRCWP